MKHEFSKLVLGAVMLLYFAGAIYGAVIVWQDSSLLGELLAYIGALTAAELAANHANDIVKYGGNI